MEGLPEAPAPRTTGTPPAAAPLDEAEVQRLANNAEAWSTCSGYETSSGCPCWDNTPYICIPKHTLGMNPNLFAILCCCFCYPTAPTAPA